MLLSHESNGVLTLMMQAMSAFGSLQPRFPKTSPRTLGSQNCRRDVPGVRLVTLEHRCRNSTVFFVISHQFLEALSQQLNLATP